MSNTEVLTNEERKRILELLDKGVEDGTFGGLSHVYPFIRESIQLRIKEYPTQYESYTEDKDCPHCMSNIAGYCGYTNNCPFCGKEIDWSGVNVIRF